MTTVFTILLVLSFLFFTIISRNPWFPVILNDNAIAFIIIIIVIIIIIIISLQNRRISGASAIHEHEREERGEKNPPVVTPFFRVYQPFAWRTVFADLLLRLRDVRCEEKNKMAASSREEPLLLL